MREKTLQAPALRPCTELSSAPWVGRHPTDYYGRMPLSMHVVLLPTWRFGPNITLGASHFGLCSRSGLWGFISGFPRDSRRSHYHPVERFPCPVPWTLQRGLGGGYPLPCAAHGGSRPGHGVETRFTRGSHLTHVIPQAIRVRSSEALKSGAGCYPVRCGRVGCRFPVGQNPLQLDSPYHVLAKRGISGTHLPFTSPFRGTLLTVVERPTRLSPNGSLLPW